LTYNNDENKELWNTWKKYYKTKDPIFDKKINQNESLHFKILKIDPNDKRYL